jgi:hypothetical protein
MLSGLLQNENVLRSNHLFLVQSLDNLKKTTPLPLGLSHGTFQLAKCFG